MAAPTSVTGRIEWVVERMPRPLFVLYAASAAFVTYFCMYAFRKPFAAASYAGESFLGSGLDLKTAFVISQIVGYTLSKYIGIKLVSEVEAAGRARWLVGLVVTAEAALLGFAVLPPAFAAGAMVLNGLALGMVWGLVVRYLEGRRTSEVLLVGLSTSFIVASGVVKDVGRWVMRAWGVTEAWMPVVVGALFLLPFLLCVYLLDRIPPPDAHDVEARVERRPMEGAERLAFLRRFAVGLVPLFAVYVAATAYRDFRDNYGVEIFAALGYEDEPGLFTATEVPIAVGVLVVLAMLNLVKDNRRGLGGAFLIMIAGALMVAGATWAHELDLVSGAVWMLLVGLGSYLVYVPFNTVLFDRMVASTRVVATAVFAIYVADALGYTGSVGMQIYKDFADPDASRFAFFRDISVAGSIAAAVLLAAAMVYFLRVTRPPSATRA